MANPRRLIRLAAASIFTKAYFRRVMSVRPQNMIGAWTFGDVAGVRAAANSILTTFPLTSFLFNGNFETAGGGAPDYFANWTEILGDGAIADETTLIHGGGHAVKVTSGAGGTTWVTQNYANNPAGMHVKPGWTVILTMWTRGDGSNAGRYAIQNQTAGGYIRSLVTTGITSATYTQVSFSHTIPAGCYQIGLFLAGPAVNGGIAYFDDVTLTSPQYTLDAWQYYGSTAVTFGQPGMGDGRTSALFNGALSGIGIGNPAYNSAFDGNVGSAIAWGVVDGAARWTDASTFRYLWHAKSRPEATVYIVQGRHTDSHTVFWRRRIAGTTYEKKYVFSPTGPITWFCMGFTWDLTSSPQNMAGWVYAPGHTSFTKVFDETPANGNELWNKTTYPVDDWNTLLAGGAANSQLWVGKEQNCYQWAGAALTDAEMRRVMVL